MDLQFLARSYLEAGGYRVRREAGGVHTRPVQHMDRAAHEGFLRPYLSILW